MTVIEAVPMARPGRDRAALAGRRSRDADGFPSSRDEAWKYTPVEEVVSRLRSATPAPSRTVRPDVVDDLAGRHGSVRLVFVNGHFAADLSDRGDIAGLWIGAAADLPAELAAVVERAATAEPDDGFAASNRAADHDTALVVVEPATTVAEPIHVVHLHAPDATLQASHPRTVVVVGAESRLNVIESYVGLPGAGFINASTTISVGERAEVTHHRIQGEDLGSVHLGETNVHQAERSEVTTTSVMIGADIARHTINIDQAGAHAVSIIDGLYVPSARQRHDIMVTLDHSASHGRSTQRLSGVIDGRAHGSFSGRVIVRADTAGNDARQSNRNLLLAPTAQANTRPWLEILADDVQCSHGATVGRLDADALFYLRSRGIPRATARTMLVEAFIGEIADAITPTTLRLHVTSMLAAHRAETQP